jgi:hypothetical protein
VRRKVMVLALVALAFMLLAGPVLAGPSRGARVISMTGTITDKAGTSIEVKVQMTNKPYLVKRGQTVWVKTSSTTVYYYWDGTTRLSWDFGKLVKGQSVAINALVISEAITARRVEVNKRGYK